ncbi:YciI family protein [Paraburkholderia sp. BCC1885]|uniref:YciI family protein n=1 Tax=Paraburkholderia sp. BCC1885 TaxID=2562669 RepID=UPI0011832FC8|nr:YciI family protein [Paraburkholderia sp. BCC1885]
MYIVELTYIQPLDAIEAHLEAHRSFLDEQYANEVFLASGPKDPRDGGIILVSGRVSREELDAILVRDPFHQHGVAAYHVTKFAPVKFHPTLKQIL